MLQSLSRETFCHYGKEHARVTVFREIAGDTLTPICAYYALKNAHPDIMLLESSPREGQDSRYSHLGIAPINTFTATGNNITLRNEDGTRTYSSDNPLGELEKFQKQSHSFAAHDHCGFAGGVAGYMAYDGIRYIESIPDSHPNSDALPDLSFTAYRYSLTFDHQTHIITLNVVVDISTNLEHDYAQALDALDNLIHQLHNATQPILCASKQEQSAINVITDCEDADFCAKVIAAKEHIAAGDVFQVVLSRNFTTPYHVEPFIIYRCLRLASPAPYMFFLNRDGLAIAGASPEILINKQGQVVTSCPLAGTRRKTHDTAKDDHIAQALLSDEKERAEHMMLVDLARNDLGKIAQPGQVKVDRLAQIQHYSHVMHISSMVTATIDGSVTGIDALKAAFPAGTLSGAPKIRAMQLIDQFEISRRGLYGGAVCLIDAHDNLHSCIAIRMLTMKNGIASMRAGAGVVADSVPELEAHETRHKVASLISAIHMAQGCTV